MPRYHFFNEIISGYKFYLKNFQTSVRDILQKSKKKVGELTRYAFCYQLACIFEAVKEHF